MPTVYGPPGAQQQYHLGGGGGGGDAAAKKKRKAIRKQKFVITDGPEKDPVDVSKAWINAQVPYENLASDEDVAIRVVDFVNEVERIYLEKTQAVRRRWRVIYHLLRGNSIANVWGLSDVHVPELYKMVEALVPRIEEAVMSYDPYFATKGRDEIDRSVEDTITAYLRYQLSEMDDTERIQPGIRDLITTQVCCEKIFWERRVEPRVVREYEETQNDDGTFTTTVMREERNVIVHQGPNAYLVDPFDLIVDTRRVRPRDMVFIGDASDMNEDEVLREGEELGWANLDRVKEQAVDGAETRARWDKRARSVTERYTGSLRNPQGAPRQHRRVELWARFNLYGGDEIYECKLVVLDGRLCLEARENPHDDKHRPYAIARAAKEGHDFFNVGILDNALRLTEEYDQHRTLIMEAHKQSSCPIVIAEDDSDFPDTLFGIRPGTVFRSIGKVTFGKIPDTLQSAPFIRSILRTDIEETVGAPRIYEGTGEQGATATEVVRKIEEGNKRTRGLIRAYADMQRQKLLIMHALNGQFMTTRIAFPVIGKMAAALSGWAQASPATFQTRVDFDFIGLANLQTLGTRASAMAQFMQIGAPFFAQYPGLFNVPAMLLDLYRLTVGTRPDDEIIKLPKMLSTLMSPEAENAQLAQGHAVRAEEEDPHLEHIPVHLAFAMDPDTSKSPLVFQVAIKHLLEHVLMQRSQELQEKAATQMPPDIVQPKGPGMDGSRAPREGASGEEGGVEQTPVGETPGPLNGQQVSKPGRRAPISADTERQGA